jgi:hypothetical protein
VNDPRLDPPSDPYVEGRDPCEDPFLLDMHQNEDPCEDPFYLKIKAWIVLTLQLNANVAFPFSVICVRQNFPVIHVLSGYKKIQ